MSNSSTGAIIAQAVQKEIDARLFPGAVVLIGTPGQVLYHEAVGFAQVEPGPVGMRKDSIFDIASVTKVVCTATAVGICKDRGLLDLNAPMTRYLTEHTGAGAEKITLRHLASHTSGVVDIPNTAANKLQEKTIFERLSEVSPSWPVETKCQYACCNTIYLGLIVEKVAGRSFEEFCRAEIFEPLEMKEVWFNKVEPSARVVATHHLVLGENHNFYGRDAGCAVGNAGLFTTAFGLVHFCEMMLGRGVWRGRRVLREETIVEFTKPYSDEFPERGVVWETNVNSSHRPKRISQSAYGHGGSTGISLWIDPEKQVYTLVLTNRTHPRVPTPTGKEPKNSPRVQEQYLARGRIADAALRTFGY